MTSEIPHDQWQPVSVPEIKQIFANAPFAWGVAGGYAIEQFVGASIRDHGDLDVVVYRDDQIQVRHWLTDWCFYAADPPGTLRPWSADEYLPFGIHDIWGHQPNVHAWQLQIMLAEVDEEKWFSRRNRLIQGQRDELFVIYNDTPCIRVEVQLLFKAKNNRPKDDLDFQACLPLMSASAKEWLADHLRLSFPEGHLWIKYL
jgi:hypothetical protein